MILIQFLFSLSFRVSGRASFYVPVVSIGNFGFLKGGTTHFTINSNLSNINGRSKLFIMTQKQYSSFIYDINNHYVEYQSCSYSEKTDEHFINLSIKSPQIFEDTIPVKGVFFLILMNCDYKFSKSNDEYFVDAVLMNPDNQHLDYRDIPKLTVYPIFIGIFIFLLVGFALYLVFSKRKFLKIYIFILLICFVYVIFLVFSFICVRFDSTQDLSRSVWDICLAVFECLYCICLFSILVLATSGWCLLNVEIRLKETALNITCVVVFFAMLYLMNFVQLGLYELAFFAFEAAAAVGVARAIFKNTSRAQKHIRAHLYVIELRGIDPLTTPIYEKFKIYTYFLYVIICDVVVMLITNIILGLFDADKWVVSLINIMAQLFIVLSMMVIFRPRGQLIDRYLGSDEQDEGERDEVRLDDLDGFTPGVNIKKGNGYNNDQNSYINTYSNENNTDNNFDSNDSKSGGRVGGGYDRGSRGAEWHEGMQLPLEPILVGEEISNDPIMKRNKDGKGKKQNNDYVTYTSIEEPLNENPNSY